VKKNRLNRLKFWKNQPVRFGFGFISLKLKKPNRTQTGKQTSQTGKQTSQTGKKPSQTGKKPSQTEKTESNRFEPVFVLKNQTKTGRFEPVSVFCIKKFGLVTFFL
jgi:hypothetical protein